MRLLHGWTNKQSRDKKMTKKLNIADLVAKINAKYGSGIIMRASQAKALDIPRIETDIFSIDVNTGGGIPIGRITGIFGPKSGGKTSLALRIIASAQGYCRECLVKMVNGKCPKCAKSNGFNTVYVDAEGTWTNEWSAAMGVNCDNVYVFRAEYAEQVLDVADSFLRSGDCDLLVIDTIAALTPMVEVEESAEKQQMGIFARLINKLYRKMISAINEPSLNVSNRPTILVLNQTRERIGMIYGDPMTRPGGKGQEFASTVDIKMRNAKYILNADKQAVSVIMRFIIDKNKSAPPRGEGEFILHLREHDKYKAGEIDDKEVVWKSACKYGVVSKEGNDWKCLNKCFRVKSDVEEMFLGDVDFYDGVRKALLDILLRR